MHKQIYIPLDTTLLNPVTVEKLIKRGDALTMTIKVFTNGVLADLTGQTINLILRKTDGTNVEKTITNISNGEITVELDENATLAEGFTNGELQIYNGTSHLGTNTFTFLVLPSIADDILNKISVDEIKTLTDLINAINSTTNAINNYVTNVTQVAGTAVSVEALANIKSYIDTHLQSLELKNGLATTNISQLTNKISLAAAESTRAEANIIAMGSFGDVSTISQDIVTTQSKIKLSVLYDAALKDMDITYNLENCKKAIKNGVLKIAFVGDSITEGANNYYMDVWVFRFVDKLKKDLPNVDIQFTNFALGGRSLGNFIDSNYKATETESNYTINFKRSWSTVGKSWKDHVKDYAADITFFCFGMNDVISYRTDYTFYNNLKYSIDYVKTGNVNMDIALVSTILPTQNKTVYGQSEIETLNVARITRELSKNNGYALIDTNRLWRILLYGIEECKFYNKELTSITEINLEKSYNFQTTITFNNATYPNGASACDMAFRSDGANFLLLRFRNNGDGNYIDLYTMSNSGSSATLLYTWSGNQIVSIQVEGSNININGVTFICYEKLYDGNLSLSQIASYVYSIYFINRINFTEKPLYKESEILGLVTDPFGQGINGNGINHPTSLGHYLTYYMASSSISNSLRMSGKVDEEAYKIQIDNINANKIDAVPTSFTDINLLQREGLFYIVGATDAPNGVSPNGYVRVHKFPGSDIHLMQEYTPYDDAGAIYKRKYNTGMGWSNWYWFAGTIIS